MLYLKEKLPDVSITYLQQSSSVVQNGTQLLIYYTQTCRYADKMNTCRKMHTENMHTFTYNDDRIREEFCIHRAGYG